MNRNLRNAFALGTFALLGTANATNAQNTYFPNDATINYTISGYAIVGYASDISGTFQTPSSPTIKVINGGNVTKDLGAYNSSTVNMSGGMVSGYAYATNNSVINMSGGNVGITLVAYQNSVVNFSGGNVVLSLEADNSGTINIFGTNLIASLADPNYFGFSFYNLSGTLQDGTVLSNKPLLTQNGTGASFHFNPTATPAPSSALVILLGAVPLVGVLRRRRK